MTHVDCDFTLPRVSLFCLFDEAIQGKGKGRSIEKATSNLKFPLKKISFGRTRNMPTVTCSHVTTENTRKCALWLSGHFLVTTPY